MNFGLVLSEIHRKTVEYQAIGKPRPEWLQKQINAVVVAETDFWRGIDLLVSALQDERDALEGTLHG